MNRFDRFQELIEEPAPPPAAEAADEIVQPLVDLARALEVKSQVGAGVVHPEGQSRSYHLALWPRHRPAFRSLMVTVRAASGRWVVTNSMFWFSTADELAGWLENFVRRPELKATLEDLREQAKDPVDARLERANGMATLARVSPELQEQLAGLAEGVELPLDLELNDGEPAPEAATLRHLNSAGLRFEIHGPTVTGRTVHLRVIKLA